MDLKCRSVSNGRSAEVAVLTNGRDDKEPKRAVEQILAIAPILPGSGAHKGPVKAAPSSTTSRQQAPTSAPTSSAHQNPANLIDLDSRPSSTVPPEPNAEAQKHNKAAVDHHNALHPTSDPQQTVPVHQSTATQAPVGNAPKQGNLLESDDDMHNTSNKMSNLNLQHQAMEPRPPVQRIDTETSDVDVFVDAEEK